MKYFTAAFLSLLLLLLPACAAQQEEPAPPWDTAPGDAPDYGEYFGQTISYDGEGMICNTGWTDSDGSYYGAELQNDALRVYTRDDAFNKVYVWTVPGGDYAGCRLAFATGSHVYLVRDGCELFRTDWYGSDSTTLYVDASGILGLPEEDSGAFAALKMVDHSIFLMAPEGDGIGIYRIYLPTMTTDLLVGGLPGERDAYYLGYPESNQTITWSCENPDFWEIYNAVTVDPSLPYLQLAAEVDPAMLIGTIEQDYDLPRSFEYHCDLATGTITEYGVWMFR